MVSTTINADQAVGSAAGGWQRQSRGSEECQQKPGIYDTCTESNQRANGSHEDGIVLACLSLFLDAVLVSIASRPRLPADQPSWESLTLNWASQA